MERGWLWPVRSIEAIHNTVRSLWVCVCQLADTVSNHKTGCSASIVFGKVIGWHKATNVTLFLHLWLCERILNDCDVRVLIILGAILKETWGLGQPDSQAQIQNVLLFIVRLYTAFQIIMQIWFNCHKANFFFVFKLNSWMILCLRAFWIAEFNLGHLR